jgi:hypothetical protein
MHRNILSGTREALPLAWPRSIRSARGTHRGYARDARVQGVGQLQSTEEAFEHGAPHGTGGEGGGKGAGQGKRGRAHQEPDTAPGSPVPSAQPRTAGSAPFLTQRLRVITRGRSPVRSCRTPGLEPVPPLRRGVESSARVYQALDSRFRGNDLAAVMPAQAGIQSFCSEN